MTKFEEINKMKFKTSLTIDKDAQSKSNILTDLTKEINDFTQTIDYGDAIHEYFIIFQIINPPNGYGHLFKDFKPKFIEYKSSINKYTGESFTIEKQFGYSIKIDGGKFENFVKATDEEAKKIIALEIINSLSNLDKLSKKVKDFDKEKFKKDISNLLTY